MKTDIQEFLRPLRIDVATVRSLAHELHHTFNDLAAESLVQFLPTPISESILRPTAGSEKGRYLAIDIGGTNLRVGFIELLGNDKRSGNSIDSEDGLADKTRLRRVSERSWPIAEHFKNERADKLFAWIGSCIADVVREGCHQFALSTTESLPLGVTFSFPMVQHTLSEATLMAMGKGFQITGNLDLGSLLSRGYELSRTDDLPPIRIVAIANDAVSTLVSFIYQSEESPTRKASMGLICGTGSNATIALKKSVLHREKLPDKVGVLSRDDRDNVKMAVNTEWTINGTLPALQKHGLVTRWDTRLDAEGDKPGFQPFEYMTAGRYLGELGRLIFLDYLINQLSLAEHLLPQQLRKRYGLSTTFLSRFKPSNAAALVQKLEDEFPITAAELQWTDVEALALYEIAKAIEIRAAGIIAAATIGLLACAGDLPLESSKTTSGQLGTTNGQLQQPVDLVVGYTGGCITHFQDYQLDCQAFLDQTVTAEFGSSPPVRVVLIACHDGGITGAGVLAGSTHARAAIAA